MVVLRSLALAAVLVAFLAACNSVQPGLYAPDKAKGHTEEGMRHDTCPSPAPATPAPSACVRRGISSYGRGERRG
jgi:hypothetical protein